MKEFHNSDSLKARRLITTRANLCYHRANMCYNRANLCYHIANLCFHREKFCYHRANSGCQCKFLTFWREKHANALHPFNKYRIRNFHSMTFKAFQFSF